MFSANRFYIHQFSNNTAGKMPELEKLAVLKMGFVFVFVLPWKTREAELTYWPLGLIFHSYEKMSNSSFSIEMILVWKNHFTECFTLKKTDLFFLCLYLDPVADITAKSEAFSTVQPKKKIGSQQKQKREAKSNNLGCHLWGLSCHQDTSLAFCSASQTTHKRIKNWGKCLP